MKNRLLTFVALFLACGMLAQHACADDLTVADMGTESSTQDKIVAQAQGWTNKAEDIIINALGLLGIEYKYGGATPESGFDCSGFVRYVFKQATNMSLPHGARAISQLGQKITPNELKPGDLVFFNTLKSTFSHVGIYLGDNKFIHAPRAGQSVRIENMNNQYWTSRYNGATRIAAEETE